MTKKEKVNKGSTLLIPKKEWVPEKEIQGNDEMVLTHPVMKKAFNKILQLHEMKHNIAFVSLCTSTRPYSKSLKWKNFKERYGDYADMIISGIVELISHNESDLKEIQTFINELINQVRKEK